MRLTVVSDTDMPHISTTWSEMSSVLIPFAYIDIIIQTYTSLVLFKELRLELAFSVPGYEELDVSEVGAKRFCAVSVAAVVCVFILVVVFRVAEFIIEFGPRSFSMNSATVSLKSF